MLGEQIRYFRKMCKLSQRDLAAQLYVSQQAIGKWERNEATPNPEAIVKMAKIFDISTDELLGEQRSISSEISESDIKAAFFNGADPTLTPEERDAMWEDAQEYFRFKIAQRRQKQQNEQ